MDPTASQKTAPPTFRAFIERFPEVAAAHEAIGKAAENAGPLEQRHCHLIKMGIAIGAGLETAFRSHVRRAAEHGATREEIEQALLLSMNTIGFPRTVMAWQWAGQELDSRRKE